MKNRKHNSPPKIGRCVAFVGSSHGDAVAFANEFDGALPREVTTPRSARAASSACGSTSALAAA
jgi:hypothetical protein